MLVERPSRFVARGLSILDLVRVRSTRVCKVTSQQRKAAAVVSTELRLLIDVVDIGHIKRLSLFQTGSVFLSTTSLQVGNPMVSPPFENREMRDITKFPAT